MLRHRKFAPIEQRPHALRPQIVIRAVPAEPAVITHVEQARSVAVDFFEPDAQFASIDEILVRRVTTRARQRIAAGQPLLEEQALAQCNCRGLAGNAIARIARPRQRPRPMLQNQADFSRRELWQAAVVVGGGKLPWQPDYNCRGKQEMRARYHSITMLCVRRSVPAAPCTSKLRSQLPGM